MSDGQHDWLHTVWHYAQGAIAAVATAASSAVGWMSYRYRKYVAMLLEAHRYVELLKKARTRSRIIKHEKQLRHICRVLEDNEYGRKNQREIEACRVEATKLQQEVTALNDEVDELSRVVQECCGTMGHIAHEMNRMRDRLEKILPFSMRRDPEDE